ncbi:hypothetical protein JW592_32000 [Streptomyces sp. DW4-2]|uniref:ATP-grasp-modified RiPP n=1 Tax=Streptomyces spirodelae TaxID=2812904 RepID=A0ABS3X3Z7_9ACTN|nr:hypothetical protein [Streptomyces spirodelae]
MYRKEAPLIDPTSLFSAPEEHSRRFAAALAPPTTNPFQAPDFGEDDNFPPADGQGPVPDARAVRPEATGG